MHLSTFAKSKSAVERFRALQSTCVGCSIQANTNGGPLLEDGSRDSEMAAATQDRVLGRMCTGDAP